MAEVLVELKEEKREEDGTQSAEAVLVRTGTKGAMRRPVSQDSRTRPRAARQPAQAPAQGARRKDARTEKENRPATGGRAGSGRTKPSAQSNRLAQAEAAVRSEGDFAASLLVQARSGRGNGKLVLVDLPKLKKPRAQPVKKPRRLHWARQWAAEPEWKAPEEGS